MQPQLSPRDGAKIPKSETLTDEQKRVMAEVEKLSQDESHALSVLAQASAGSHAATEDAVDLLQDIKDLLVKAFVHFGVGLPKSIQDAMDAGEYNPDDVGGDEEDEDGEGDPA